MANIFELSSDTPMPMLLLQPSVMVPILKVSLTITEPTVSPRKIPTPLFSKFELLTEIK